MDDTELPRFSLLPTGVGVAEVLVTNVLVRRHDGNCELVLMRDGQEWSVPLDDASREHLRELLE